MFLLLKSRRVKGHIVRLPSGFYTVRHEHGDKRDAKRLEKIDAFLASAPKFVSKKSKKRIPLTDEQKVARRKIADWLVAGKTWVDSKGNEITDEATLERIKKLNINNPTMVDVHISNNPKTNLQATVWYINMHGEEKLQHIYTRKHVKESDVAKFLRCKKFSPKYASARKIIDQDAKDGVEEAIAAHLMFLTNMRVGTEKEAKTKVKAYGATTLQVRHLSIDDGTLYYDFIGKSGARWNSKIEDETLTEAITALCGDKDQDEPVFSVNASKVNEYLSQFGNFTAKDIRYLHATAKAASELKKARVPRNAKGAKALIKEICIKVSKILNHVPANGNVAKGRYINPVVWADLEMKYGIQVIKPKED